VQNIRARATSGKPFAVYRRPTNATCECRAAIGPCVGTGSTACIGPGGDLIIVEGYLMTTPGGINAVMGTAVGFPQVDVALVTIAQIVRLLAMALVMPVLVRLLLPKRTT
jgi:hypothetical protein